MSNIQSTITLNSTTLFPNPVFVNVTANEQINGDADLQTITINPNENVTLFGPTFEGDLSNTVYFYAHSSSDNVSNINVYLQDQNETQILLASLHPSDFIWLPLAVYGANVKISCSNLDSYKSSKINLFWGYRS